VNEAHDRDEDAVGEPLRSASPKASARALAMPAWTNHMTPRSSRGNCSLVTANSAGDLSTFLPDDETGAGKTAFYIDRYGVKRTGTSLPANFALSSALGSPRSSP
jgi:hypothetical protein